MWPDRQSDMAGALNASNQTLSGLASRRGPSSEKRFAVYRNNAIVNTRTHLAAVFPVVEALIGVDAFNEIARRFIVSHPPKSPVLLEYGVGFDDFLRAEDAFRRVPYLGDVAALEWARYQAYHAADAVPIEVSVLSEIDPTALGDVTLTLHPSLCVLRSAWPITSIWYAHQQADPSAALKDIVFEPQSALIVRPDMEVQLRTLSADAAAMLAAFQRGETLNSAFEAAADEGSDDLSACLGGAFTSGAVVAVHVPSEDSV